MNKVYIPQEPTRWDASVGASVPMYDFSRALRYGELVVCLPPNVSFHMTRPIVTALRERLRDFTADDYLIAVGSPVIIAISAHIALQRTGGRLNLLSWDRREGEYLNTVIEMPGSVAEASS